jgi:hypothetical protein
MHDEDLEVVQIPLGLWDMLCGLTQVLALPWMADTCPTLLWNCLAQNLLST